MANQLIICIFALAMQMAATSRTNTKIMSSLKSEGFIADDATEATTDQKSEGVVENGVAVATEEKVTGTMDGIDSLKAAIGNLPRAHAKLKKDAQDFLDTFIGGLNSVGYVSSTVSSKGTQGANLKVTVTLTEANVIGELATRSKVPYQIMPAQEMTFEARAADAPSEAINLITTGFYFAPPPDARTIMTEALASKDQFTNKKPCNKLCGNPSNTSEVVVCESCIIWEWYQANREEVDGREGKVARILSKTPWDISVMWVKLLDAEKSRRIIYSMLAAAPTALTELIFGRKPEDFGAPEGKYSKDQYMGAENKVVFDGNPHMKSLEDFFLENDLSAKSLEIGKVSLESEFGLKAAEKAGQGVSGINFARMVAAGNENLKKVGVYLTPAKPSKVMKMLKVCEEATPQLGGNKAIIDTGCDGDSGRVLWRLDE